MVRREQLALAILLGLAAAAVLLRLVVGGHGLAWPDSETVWGLRSQRAVDGAIVGACLAVAGVMLQSLLRNPLASPEILGLSAGASFMVMLSVYLAGLGVGGAVLATLGVQGGVDEGGLGTIGWQAGPALIGAMAALGLVYAISQRGGAIDPAGLVLVGVVISIMCSAGVMLLQHLMPGKGLGGWRLLVGALTDDTTWPQLGVLGAIGVGGIAVGWRFGPAMDAAAMGADEAASVGVRMGRLRATLFISAGVLTAAAVLLAGPVSFVGLICPHLTRLVAGPNATTRALVIGSALAGISLVVGADAAIKAIELASGRLPLGVVTALVGGVVFIILLRRTRMG